MRLYLPCHLVLAAIPALASAVPAEITCPAALPRGDLTLNQAVEGWHFYAASPLYLHSAAPMATPPEKLGHLIEDSHRKRKDEEIYTYRLEGPF
ncbi:MAG TPA: STY0301 family protein, partial [Pseudoduganella sp.]